MAGHAFTLSTKNLAQVQNGLRRYGQQALVRAKGAVKESADRTFAVAQDLCPRDTGYEAEHMRETISDSGFGYEVGFREEDFVGQTNPATGQEITYFYPLATEFGTSRMAAQPCIFPAAAIERPRFKRALAEALRPPRGAAPSSRGTR